MVPDRLVLGGIIGSIPAFVDQVRARVVTDVVDRIAEGLTVEAGDPGAQSAIQGLTSLVMRKVFAAEAIDSVVTDFALP